MSLIDRAVASALPFVPRPLVVRFSRPYIAGKTLSQALEVVGRLNARGMMATLDLLGENVTSLSQAEGFRDAYLRILDEIVRSGLDTNVSLKLTQLGLALDRQACASNLRAIVGGARERGLFVRVDMEDSPFTDATLGLHAELRREFDNFGVVLQSMLRRTAADAEGLARMQANIRLCKGIYREPWSIAYTDRELVSRSYVAALETLLRAGCYVGIATHDERLIFEGMRLIRLLGIPRERVEFQMLLGVREELRTIILGEGHRLRIYVPFGEQATAYALRRMRENPRVARAVVGALFRGGFRR